MHPPKVWLNLDVIPSSVDKESLNIILTPLRSFLGSSFIITPKTLERILALLHFSYDSLPITHLLV